MNDTAQAIAKRCVQQIAGLLAESERAEAQRRFYTVAAEELAKLPPTQAFLPMYGGER